MINICKSTKCKFEVHFEGTDVYVLDDHGTTLSGFINKTLYVAGQSECANILLKADVHFESMKLHNRLGHIRHKNLLCLAKIELIGSLNKVNTPPCEPHLVGKTTRIW